MFIKKKESKNNTVERLNKYNNEINNADAELDFLLDEYRTSNPDYEINKPLKFKNNKISTIKSEGDSILPSDDIAYNMDNAYINMDKNSLKHDNNKEIELSLSNDGEGKNSAVEDSDDTENDERWKSVWRTIIIGMPVAIVLAIATPNLAYNMIFSDDVSEAVENNTTVIDTVVITESLQTVLSNDVTDVPSNSEPLVTNEEGSVVVEDEQFIEYDDISDGGREQLKLKDPPFTINEESEKIIEDSISLLKTALKCDAFIAENTLNVDTDKLEEFVSMLQSYNDTLDNFSSQDCTGKEYQEYVDAIVNVGNIYNIYFKEIKDFCEAGSEDYTEKVNQSIAYIANEIGDISWIFTKYSDIFYFYGLYE